MTRDILITDMVRQSKKIRQDIIQLSKEHGNGHIAPALSIVEILVCLYEIVMLKDDQFILSKGHGALALFAVLRDKGFNPQISGHPDIDVEQGIMCTSGSLGHGIGMAAGKALAKQIKNEAGIVYVLVGDGECQEGVVWEVLNIARRFKLENLIIIVDYNKLQALGFVEDIMDETNLISKFQAFGAYVIETDGHDFGKLFSSFEKGLMIKEQPTVIVAHTVKGKGISFMENQPKWHVCPLNEEQRQQALQEIKE